MSAHVLFQHRLVMSVIGWSNGRMTLIFGVGFDISGICGSFELRKNVIVLCRSVVVTVTALFWTLLKTIMFGIFGQYVSCSTLFRNEGYINSFWRTPQSWIVLWVKSVTAFQCFVRMRNTNLRKRTRMKPSRHGCPFRKTWYLQIWRWTLWCPLNQVFKPFGNGISSLVILLRWLGVRYKFCSFYATVFFWRL